MPRGKATRRRSNSDCKQEARERTPPDLAQLQPPPPPFPPPGNKEGKKPRLLGRTDPPKPPAHHDAHDRHHPVRGPGQSSVGCASTGLNATRARRCIFRSRRSKVHPHQLGRPISICENQGRKRRTFFLFAPCVFSSRLQGGGASGVSPNSLPASPGFSPRGATFAAGRGRYTSGPLGRPCRHQPGGPVFTWARSATLTPWSAAGGGRS